MTEQKMIIQRLVQGFILLVVYLLAAQVKAQVYSQIIAAEGSSQDAVYSYVIELWNDVGDDQANPCFNRAPCMLKISHQHDLVGGGGTSEPSTQVILQIDEYPTLGDVRRAFIQRYSLPLSGTIEHVGIMESRECVGLFYGPRVENSSGDFILPGSICGMPPYPVGRCSATPEAVLLEHGEIRALYIEQGTAPIATARLNIQCDEPMTIKIASAEDSHGISLQGGVIAKLYINEQPAAAGVEVDVAAGGTEVVVTSVLSADGEIKPGFHYGSSVLILAFA